MAASAGDRRWGRYGLRPMIPSIVPLMDPVQVDRAGGVVTITLNRPERKNAVNYAMWGQLRAAAGTIRENRDDRCVVLTGAGGSFSSGADVGGTDDSAPKMHALERMDYIHSAVQALHDLPQPTIAKVRGVAAGIGLSMALGCDLVVASPDARFSEIFAKRGLSLDGGGSWILPRLIGMHKAKELCLFAEMIDAPAAQALGIVNRVVPEDQIDDFVQDWAARLAAGPLIALSMTKRMLNRSFELSFEQTLEEEGRCQAVNFGTRDTAEAMIAFVERREPTFEGR